MGQATTMSKMIRKELVQECGREVTSAPPVVNKASCILAYVGYVSCMLCNQPPLPPSPGALSPLHRVDKCLLFPLLRVLAEVSTFLRVLILSPPHVCAHVVVSPSCLPLSLKCCEHGHACKHTQH